MPKCIFCRQSDKPFKEEIDLGPMYPSAFVPKDFPYSQAKQYETKLISCSNCGFVQMSEWPPQDEMYRKYFYRSNLNSSMRDALADIIVSVYERKPALKNGFASRVLDIGSNDGTLLDLYPEHWFRVGVDPATNLRGYYSQRNCDLFINDYFGSKLHFSRSFDIITSIAMFYDLPDPHDFVQGIKQNLSKNGVWVMQMTDLFSMIKDNLWDSVVSEHCAFWTLKHFIKLLAQFDLEVFDVEYNNVNGCSIRTYIGHKGAESVDISVDLALQAEGELLTVNSLPNLNLKVIDIGNRLMNFITEEKSNGKTFCGLGASTKGNTLLQCVGLSNWHLDCIGEVNQDKFGLFTVGSHIPIVSESAMFDQKPDYVLILPHHFKDNIVKRHKYKFEQGIKFIVALPEPTLILSDVEVKI